MLIEDNASRSERRNIEGLHQNGTRAAVVVRLHNITGSQAENVAEYEYFPGTLLSEHGASGRAGLALSLLDSWRSSHSRPLVLAGTTYGSTRTFVQGVIQRGLPLVAELRPSDHVDLACGGLKRGVIKSVQPRSLLDDAKWRFYKISSPSTAEPVPYAIARLGQVRLDAGVVGTLFAAQVGAIKGLHQDTIVGVSSVRGGTLKQLLEVAGWIRWIRPITRILERKASSHRHVNGPRGARTQLDGIQFRSNIYISRRRDEALNREQEKSSFNSEVRRGYFRGKTELHVGELFAGAGGMGLGFLLASSTAQRGYRLVVSAEVNPIYVQTLRRNHKEFAKSSHRQRAVPEATEPTNLADQRSLDRMREEIYAAGGLDVLVGGPPCQGFSNSNRNSWNARNPHNRFVDVFLHYVERLKPPVFLMENVQGILWTPRHSGGASALNVVDALSKRLKKAGYELFPKLLDAVWYGVPQHRTRFFLLGILRDLEYQPSDFGPWGPFPRPTHGTGEGQPYVTVGDALKDLPRIENGHFQSEMDYSDPVPEHLTANTFLKEMRHYAPQGVVFDHVTSRHADYVIDRYRQIPPGGNWESIVDDLTNYADVKRTHSNIYRRLTWDEPAITIGHYRKSMLVHPTQHRGLSLREASRLQSFPDWFRFAGTADSTEGGLVHKQQQLANAVCPLVTKAIAEFILEL